MMRSWGLLVSVCAAFVTAGCEKPIDAASFAFSAARSIQFEIATSRIAAARATGGYVKLLAQQIISEYEASAVQLASATKEMGVASPTSEYDEDMLRKLDELKSSAGPAFDQLYIELQLKAHENAVNLYTHFVARGEEGALKRFAQEKLALIEKHLSHVRGMKPAT